MSCLLGFSKILGAVEEVCKVVGEAHVGLDTVLIATDSAATELGGTLFLIGRNLGLRLPHITRSHFYIGGGGIGCETIQAR